MAAKKHDQKGTDFPKIGNPALNTLIVAGYTRLDQLTKVSEADILKLHGMGPKALGILRDTLAEKGLSFAPGKEVKSKKK